MISYEAIIIWSAVLLHAFSFSMFLYGIVFRKENAVTPALLLALAGFLLHSIALAARWVSAGHGPYVLKYEIIQSNAWMVTAVYLYSAWKYRNLRTVGIVTMPVIILMMGAGAFMDTEVHGLSPVLEGIWLIVHIAFNHLSVGSLTIALGSSLLFILKERHPVHGLFRKLPALDILDGYSHKFMSLAFTFWSITVIAGSLWAHQAWGRYWGWDPVEIWSLVTWLLFGLYLHVRLAFRVKGRRAALMLFLCFAVLIFNIYLIPALSRSLHSAYL